MSDFSIDDLIHTAAGDGCDAFLDLEPHRMEYGDLLRAWSLESGQRIECEILLQLSRVALARILASHAHSTPAERNEARDLIRAIDLRLRLGSQIGLESRINLPQ